MIFIDAGAFIAHHIQRDQHHRQALLSWQELERSRQRCCTTNLVLAESWTYIGKYAGNVFAAERARVLMESASVLVWRPLESDDHGALEFFEKFADQRVGFVDCISFAMMRKNGLKRAFTFDHHFELAGFKIWPRKQA